MYGHHRTPRRLPAVKTSKSKVIAIILAGDVLNYQNTNNIHAFYKVALHGVSFEGKERGCGATSVLPLDLEAYNMVLRRPIITSPALPHRTDHQVGHTLTIRLLAVFGAINGNPYNRFETLRLRITQESEGRGIAWKLAVRVVCINEFFKLLFGDFIFLGKSLNRRTILARSNGPFRLAGHKKVSDAEWVSPILLPVMG
ncbi:unnamed protein product, partial [Nesidiocoris tenuis]